MKLEYRNDDRESYFELSNEIENLKLVDNSEDNSYKIIWNPSDLVCSTKVDSEPVEIKKNDILFLTPFQNLEIVEGNEQLRIFKFNRELYCIQDHDEEVSCIGILFYGVSEVMKISIPEDQVPSFEIIYNEFLSEMNTDDSIQGEMITSLLKNIIIKSTRLAKQQIQIIDTEEAKIDIIREFNILVEKNFRELKKVNEYAELLHKSPKTLSNLFAHNKLESPSRIISNRILLESKRMFLYTNKSDKEIAYELGYTNPSHFSRFIKTATGFSPKEYKKKILHT